MLKDKTVVVTGGGRNIGAAIAVRFAREGANIVINDLGEAPEELVKEIESHGVSVLSAPADISKFDQAEALVQRAKAHFGSLDVLVNNAGITRDNLLIRMTEEEFDLVMAVNLKGAFNTTRHAAGLMLKQKSGAIINMSSVVGVGGNVGQANYAASKAALLGLTKATARELASRGVTCNAIAPGYIDSDMTRKLPDAVKEKWMESIPLRRFGTIADVAEAAVFLASNPYITGQVLHVDGGLIM